MPIFETLSREISKSRSSKRLLRHRELCEQSALESCNFVGTFMVLAKESSPSSKRPLTPDIDQAVELSAFLFRFRDKIWL